MPTQCMHWRWWLSSVSIVKACHLAHDTHTHTRSLSLFSLLLREGSGYPIGYPVLGNSRGGFPLPSAWFVITYCDQSFPSPWHCLSMAHSLSGATLFCTLEGIPLSATWGRGGRHSASAVCQSLTWADPPPHTAVFWLWILFGTNQVSRYQKKHSPTHTHRGHQISLSASSIYYDPWHPPYSIHTLYRTFSTICLQVFFGLSLYLAPSTSYSIRFFTQSLSSFRSTCPYHRNLFCCSTEIMSSNPSVSLNSLLGTILPFSSLPS